MNPNSTLANPVSPTQKRRKESYDKLVAAMLKIESSKVGSVNLDIPTLVATVLGAWPKIQKVMAELAKVIGDDGVKEVELIEECARALMYAHTQWQLSHSDNELQAYNAAATALRDLMFADMSCQIKHASIEANALDGYQGTTGYKVVATDVMLLSAAASNNWDKIQGKCAITESDIDRAEAIGMAMLRLVGLREQSHAKIEEATEMRARAFALMLQYWDTARRGISFVRWHEGDADDIAPSLYAGRKHNKQTTEEPDEQPEADAEPAIAQPPAASAQQPATAPQPATTTPPVTTNPHGPFVV